MKKTFIKFLVNIFLLVLLSSQFYCVYADGSDAVTDSNWVQKAFTAAYSFLTESVDVESGSASEPEKMVGNILKIFREIVKFANIVLLIALFGLSAISISIIGLRYMWMGANPKALEKVKKDLHTTVIGMGYGFGAFAIWNIAMAIVVALIEALAG